MSFPHTKARRRNKIAQLGEVFGCLGEVFRFSECLPRKATSADRDAALGGTAIEAQGPFNSLTSIHACSQSDSRKR